LIDLVVKLLLLLLILHCVLVVQLHRFLVVFSLGSLLALLRRGGFAFVRHLGVLDGASRGSSLDVVSCGGLLRLDDMVALGN